MLENIKKLIAEMNQEIEMFEKMELEEETSVKKFNWRIEQFKRRYAIDKLNELLEVINA